MLKKSSQELLYQRGKYLAWIIPRTRSIKQSSWGHKWS